MGFFFCIQSQNPINLLFEFLHHYDCSTKDLFAKEISAVV